MGHALLELANALVAGPVRLATNSLAQVVAAAVVLASWGRALALPTSMVQLVRMHGAPETATDMASA
jgi:hypothetical protein